MQGTVSHEHIRGPVGVLPASAKATEQSFALQYTSLILIVLTFIVGALIRPHLPAVQSQVGKVLQQNPEIGVLSFSNLYVKDSLDPSVPGALMAFAMNHDVHLQIDVFGDAERTEEERMTQALSRSVTLQRHLIDSGVLPQALSIRSYSSSSQHQATVRISHMQQ